jgi:hypothetical protein
MVRKQGIWFGNREYGKETGTMVRKQGYGKETGNMVRKQVIW